MSSPPTFPKKSSWCRRTIEWVSGCIHPILPIGFAKLRSYLQTDTDFLEATQWPGEEDPVKMLEAHPSLRPRSHHEWAYLAKKAGYWNDWDEAERLLKSAPPTIRYDKELLMKLCSGGRFCLIRIIMKLPDVALLADEEFTKHLIMSTGHDTRYFVLDVLMRRIEKSVRTTGDELIRRYSREAMKNCLRLGKTARPGQPTVFSLFYLPYSFWAEHPDVTTEYFKAGYPMDFFHRSLKHSRKAFLLAAEYGPRFHECRYDYLKLCDRRLLNDRDFVLKLLEKDPTLYFSKFFLLGGDRDVALQVVASPQIKAAHWRGREKILLKLYSNLQWEIGQMESFLHIMDWSSSKRCHLDDLARTIIRGYLGLPTMGEVQKLQEARPKLEWLLAAVPDT